jgi:hypothetical protein
MREFNSQYDPDETEFIDDIEVEDDENLSIDYHEELSHVPDAGQSEPQNPARKYKIKKMPKSWARAVPQAESILITRTDGRQILFVRN